MTSGASNLTQTSAELSGSASIKDAQSSGGSAYFYYSTVQGDSESLKENGYRVPAGRIASTGGDFHYALNSLTSATTYYFVASVIIDGVEGLGDVKSFTTDRKRLPVRTEDYADLAESSVTLSGWSSQEGSEGVSVIYGIEYSRTDLTTEATTLKTMEKDSEGLFSFRITGLSSNTMYYYRAFFFLDGIRTYGDVKTFVTADFDAELIAGDASDIEKYSATLNGTFSVSSIEELDCQLSFFYSDTEISAPAIKEKGLQVSATLMEDGSFHSCITSLLSNRTYYYIACAKVYDKEFISDVNSFRTFSPSYTYIPVDLGLSVCWSSCNLGAESPEDHGDYYAWAAVETWYEGTAESPASWKKEYGYEWDSVPFNNGLAFINEDYWRSHKSECVDKNNVLRPENDAAHVRLGGKWRMPTKEEYTELIENCTWTWTEYYGVKGRRVTSNIPGYTDKWIFLPVSGYYWGKTIHYYPDPVGNYWTSSLVADEPNGWVWFIRITDGKYMARKKQNPVCLDIWYVQYVRNSTT